MAKKYASALTSTITPDNWEDKLQMSKLSLDDITNLIGDFKAMEKMGKMLSGYLKVAARARIPEDEDFYEGPNWALQFNPRSRAGGMDEEKILEDMGEEWTEDHRKPPIEYTEMRVSAVE
jgi:hypothetical protein